MSSKAAIDGLAILTGKPAFSTVLHVGRPNVGNRERLLARIDEIIDTRWLSNDGPFVHQFERKIAEMVGVKHCVCVCNATAGLEILVNALGLSGEVIVPAFTFVATVHALKWMGVTPVFCDIEAATHDIDPAEVEKLISPRTTGITGVHLWGRPCDIDALTKIARAHNLKLMFDASHAFGCSYQGRMIGSFGDAEVFSFHATKFINCGEGGAIVTNNDGLAGRVRLMKNFGFAGYDNVVSIGTNGKMSELSAVMGLTNLESIDSFVRTNRDNLKAYQDNLSGVPGISLLRHDGKNASNYQYVVLEVDAFEAGITRDQLLAVLHAENVWARRYFYPGVHRMEPYRSALARLELRGTEAVAKRVLVLPTGTGVTIDDIEKICAIIRLAIDQSDRVIAACQRVKQ